MIKKIAQFKPQASAPKDEPKPSPRRKDDSKEPNPGFDFLSYLDFKAQYESQDHPIDLLEGLVPGVGIGAWHGQPRDGKTLMATRCAVAIASGKAVFGIDVPESKRVGYVSEEDPPWIVIERIDAVCKGIGIAPEDISRNFYLLARQGLSLDLPAHQDWLIQRVLALKLDYLVLDPLRSLTAAADQGPAEIQPFIGFIRQVQNAVRAKHKKELAVEFVHHDTKPPANVRARESREKNPSAHHMSGGAILSVVETPKHCIRRSLKAIEITDDRKVHRMIVLVRPSLTKYDAEMEPFDVEITITKVRVTVQSPSGKSRKRWRTETLRFERRDGTPASGTDAQQDLAAQIREHFTTHPEADLSARELGKLLGRDRRVIGLVLNQLCDAGALYRHGSTSQTRYRLPRKKAKA